MPDIKALDSSSNLILLMSETNRKIYKSKMPLKSPMEKIRALKYQIRPLTLDDKIIKDGLEAVGTLTGKEPYYLVGGMGVQSYLSGSFRRPTSDIDLSIVKPINYEDFKNLMKPVIEYLKDNHYNVTSSKHSRSCKLEVEDSKNPNDRLFIECSRRNLQNFEKSEYRLKRELENSKNKILEERGSTYVVACPEDLVVPKLVRSVHCLERNPSFKKYISAEKEPNGYTAKPLSEDDIKNKLNYISKLREEATLFPGSVELSEELRFASDLYDTRVLSEITGFNGHYFLNICKDWYTINDNSSGKQMLLEAVLPKFIEEIQKS